MLKVESRFKELIQLSCETIRQKRVIEFYYESKRRKEGRTIRPYMVLPRGKNIELVGLPIEELNKPLKDRQPGHYTLIQLLSRIENEQFRILPEIFDDPGVLREIVDATKSKVICRFIYDDENVREVKKQWLQVQYV